MGKGGFASLNPKERAQFAQKALEYAVGRPRQSEQGPMDGDDGPGLVFDSGEPEPPLTGEVLDEEGQDVSDVDAEA